MNFQPEDGPNPWDYTDLDQSAVEEAFRLLRRVAPILRRWRAMHGDLGFPEHEDGCLFSESGLLAGSIDAFLGADSGLSQDDYKADHSLCNSGYDVTQDPDAPGRQDMIARQEDSLYDEAVAEALDASVLQQQERP